MLAGSPAAAQTVGHGGAPTDTANDGAVGATVSAHGGLPYGDVNDTSVHYPNIKLLADDGIFDGTDCDAGFCPDEPLARWTLAVWLVRILDGDDPPNRVSRFADIAGSPWWEGHVERLAELEVTLGCKADPPLYCPDQSVTRAQMASFIARAFDLASAADSGFEDVAATNTHRGDIDALAASGVTRGCRSSPPLYCPDEPTTRAEMASFLHRARILPRHLELNVFYCGPSGVYDEARLQAEVDLLQQHVDGFYRRQSGFDASGGTRGTTITFNRGGILPADILPEGEVWQNQTLGDWYHKTFHELWSAGSDDPCRVAAENQAKNQTDNSRSVILLNVASGAEDILGYAPVGDGPATSLTVERQGEFFGYSQRQFLNHTVAHEIGHAFYGWEHPWKDSDIDVPTSEQLESLMSTPEETAKRGLAPRLNLAPGEANSAYIACINLKQQNWIDQEADGNCRRPSAGVTEPDVPDDGESPAPPLELRISWGGDASARSDCPSSEDCRSLRYEYIGNWPQPPYVTECWSNGQRGFGPFNWSGDPSRGCIFWDDDETAQVVINGIRSNEINYHDPTTTSELELRISWGGDASARSDCPSGEDCRSLRYEYIGNWPQPPYATECWSNGQRGFGPFNWSGDPSRGCIFWDDDETAQVVVNGIRSNQINYPTTTALPRAELSTS